MTICAQQQEKKRSFSIHIIEGYRYEEFYIIDNNEYSKAGLEGQFTFHLNEKWGIQWKGSWLRWKNNRETTIPVLLGPEFRFLKIKEQQLYVYFNGGPSLTIGNDYAGIFATLEGGIQFSSIKRKGLTAGMAWGQYLVFHPSQFSFLKGSVGWRF
jgi:hypothetical protein